MPIRLQGVRSAAIACARAKHTPPHARKTTGRAQVEMMSANHWMTLV